MRYMDTGEVHKDFHLGTNLTINYIVDKYDRTFLSELCQRTAHYVYQDIYQQLKQRNPEPLLEHWSYYTKREGGEFVISRTYEEIVFHMNRCPMLTHIKEKGQSISLYMKDFLSFYCTTGPGKPRILLP